MTNKKQEEKGYKAILRANNTEYFGKGDTLEKALLNITVKLIYTGGSIEINGEKEIKKNIHIMQMKRLFGINKTAIRLYAKQLTKDYVK